MPLRKNYQALLEKCECITAISRMVPPTGFEPVTSSLPMTRSTAGAMAAHYIDSA